MRRAARRSQAQEVSLPAPVKGLVRSTPAAAADPLAAEWLENWLPTDRGIRVRGGISRAAFVTDAVKTLFPYIDATAPEFFAATADAVYNISSLNATTAPAPVISGMTSGDWSSQQIGTAGGDFMMIANGADFVHVYDGGDWHPLADEAISDLAYDNLSADYAIGETVTGGTSGANATIYGIIKTSATAGVLKVGTVSSGPFQDDEEITSAAGTADVDGVIAAASSLTVSGVTTSDLSDVWLHQNRLFFIEKDTLNAWYLPVGSVGGTANKLNLAGVFRRGGKLLFGATWSLDGGDGLDDKCVFITTQGEVAVYSGTNPASATTWGLEGRYDIGKPLGKRGKVTVGGDLLVATDAGIVPLSAAVSVGPGSLTLTAATRQIENLWTEQVDEVSTGVELHRWTEESLMAVVFPGAGQMWTANVETAAWASQTGWQGDCAALYLGNLYVGRSDGRVYKLDDTGTDDGDAFTARACFSFSDLGAPTAYKACSMIRAAFYASGAYAYRISICTEYRVAFPAAPPAALNTGSDMIWGTSDWGDATWASDVSDPQQGVMDTWRSVSGVGYVMAPAVQVTSGGTKPMQFELLSLNLLIDVGGRVA